jgi:hypothetical protein
VHYSFLVHTPPHTHTQPVKGPESTHEVHDLQSQLSVAHHSQPRVEFDVLNGSIHSFPGLSHPSNQQHQAEQRHRTYIHVTDTNTTTMLHCVVVKWNEYMERSFIVQFVSFRSCITWQMRKARVHKA